jgi:hypothetical protein
MRYFLSRSSSVDTFSLSLVVPSLASPRTPGAKRSPYCSRRVPTFVSLRFSRIVPLLSRLRPSNPTASAPRLLPGLRFVVTISSNSLRSLRTSRVLTPNSEATSSTEGYGVDMTARSLIINEATPSQPVRQNRCQQDVSSSRRRPFLTHRQQRARRDRQHESRDPQRLSNMLRRQRLRERRHPAQDRHHVGNRRR